jgi:hypothetical protein
MHFTAMFDEAVPCCHLLADGVPRPRMTKNPELQAVRERDPPPPKRKTALQAIAAGYIKRESQTGKKLEVERAWVDHKLEAQVSRLIQGPVRYVDNMPVLLFIAEGVSHFRLDL